jgi:lysophospholipase L1-like esterase
MQRPEVISWTSIHPGDDASNPDDAMYQYRLLAEGDSWFTLGGLPTSNLLFSMKFDAGVIIVTCGSPGDTIRNMGQIASNANLGKAMSKRYGYRWDAILLSGGGNDLIDAADEIVKRRSGAPADPAAYCDEARLTSTLEKIKTGYRNIIELRDKAGSSCINRPVITHTYDWVTPRNSPARFVFVPLLGPWLYTALVSARVPQERWNAVSDYLLARLRDALLSLVSGADGLPNFHVVTTQGTLARAEPGALHDSGDWMNEIHPNSRGYEKIAVKISRKVRRLLKAR